MILLENARHEKHDLIRVALSQVLLCFEVVVVFFGGGAAAAAGILLKSGSFCVRFLQPPPVSARSQRPCRSALGGGGPGQQLLQENVVSVFLVGVSHRLDLGAPRRSSDSLTAEVLSG